MLTAGTNRPSEPENAIKPKAHLVASLGVGAGLYGVNPDPVPAMAAVLAGTLIDLDHLYDLWAYQKHRKPFEKLLTVMDSHHWVKSYIFLHALEGIPFLAAMIFAGTHPWLWTGILVGYTLHLVMDLLGNKCYPLTYFLSYRIYRRFDAPFLWTDSRPGGAIR